MYNGESFRLPSPADDCAAQTARQKFVYSLSMSLLQAKPKFTVVNLTLFHLSNLLKKAGDQKGAPLSPADGSKSKGIMGGYQIKAVC